MTSARPEACVVLNPAARGGRGRPLWDQLRARAAEHLELAAVIETTADGSWSAALQQRLAERCAAVVVAAGGDGTVGAVAHCLIAVPARQRPLLGAVGLGSSNDFHKPLARRAPVPLRVDPRRTVRRDLCRAELCDGQTTIVRHFVVSASAGFTARANARFNRLSGPGAWLKARWTGGAIAVAAMATLWSHRNLPISLRVAEQGQARSAVLTNLSLLKTPFISGSFSVDFPVLPDDGQLGVALCQGLGRAGVLRVLADLSAGRFTGRPGREHFHTPWLELSADERFAVELDGEILEAVRARFDVLPGALEVCT